MTYLVLMQACEDEADRTLLRAELWEKPEDRRGIRAASGSGPPKWMRQAGKK